MPTPIKAVSAKVVLLGATGVGKTSILARQTEEPGSQKINPTIGAAMFRLTIVVDSDNMVDLEIWDTAGQERFHSLTKTYTRNAVAALLVFDLTNTGSFIDLKQWNDVLEEAGAAKLKVIVGNKLDLVNNDPDCRKVGEDDIYNFAQKIDAESSETSAVTGQNVNELFQMLAEKIVERNLGRLSQHRKGSDGAEQRAELDGFELNQRKCCSKVL